MRNALFGQKVPWTLIRAVSFPDGAPWARLELPDDEYVPVVAIQAMDGERAVARDPRTAGAAPQVHAASERA